MINDLLDKIWDKADRVQGYNPDLWRKDLAGAWIRRDQFGAHSQYGWSIDHIKPKSKGGDDSIENLQALHWQNNISKAGDYEEFTTCVTSEGNNNIFKVKVWRRKNS